MATTTNFGWETPDDSDLVKDGAQSIRTLGSSIDTSLADLKGGTTGQVLSKATNTDMDFVWVTQDDADAIQNSIIDAKGDLIAGNAADTPIRIAVGSNGHVLTADSTVTGGVKWAAPASGSMTLLSTTTLTGAASITVSSISQSYKSLAVYVYNVNLPNDGIIRIAPNNLTTVSTGAGLTQTNPQSFRDDQLRLSLISQTNNNTDNVFWLTINEYTAATTKPFSISGAIFNATVRQGIVAGGFINTTSAITSLVFTSSGAGNFQGGTVKVYGVM